MLDAKIPISSRLNSVACKQQDARCLASRFLRNIPAEIPGARFAYGNESEVIVCIGKQALAENPAMHDWQQVHSILSRHADDYVFGFLGYGLGLIASNNSNEAFPPYWFGSADFAIRFSPESMQLLRGDADIVDDIYERIPACRCRQKQVELVAALDHSSEARYLAQVEQVLDWVRQEECRRMTVARRVPLPPVDLLGTFHCQPSHNKLSRTFYLDIGSAAFVGKCPEVLLEWKPGKFEAFKLSGTYPRDKNPDTDRALLEQFLSDPKIIAEHKLSADGFGAGVAKAGEVTRSGPHVLDLYRLRHMMTAFTVKTAADTPVSECLRAVLPPGVSPCAEGLPALLAIEKEKRGPYYGLVGFYSPDKKASFTQILRSVFRQQENYYSWVGAAVTQGSTAKGELEESKLKLSDIVVTLK